jgi:hypothetical protein
MRWAKILCLAASGLIVCSLGGCGGGGPDAATVESNKKFADLESRRKADSTEELKKKLAEMAETGAGGSGSGLAGLRTSIENLRASNPAVADALLQDLSNLSRPKAQTRSRRLPPRWPPGSDVASRPTVSTARDTEALG